MVGSTPPDVEASNGALTPATGILVMSPPAIELMSNVDPSPSEALLPPLLVPPPPPKMSPNATSLWLQSRRWLTRRLSQAAIRTSQVGWIAPQWGGLSATTF